MNVLGNLSETPRSPSANHNTSFTADRKDLGHSSNRRVVLTDDIVTYVLAEPNIGAQEKRLAHIFERSGDIFGGYEKQAVELEYRSFCSLRKRYVLAMMGVAGGCSLLGYGYTTFGSSPELAWVMWTTLFCGIVNIVHGVAIIAGVVLVRNVGKLVESNDNAPEALSMENSYRKDQLVGESETSSRVSLLRDALVAIFDDMISVTDAPIDAMAEHSAVVGRVGDASSVGGNTPLVPPSLPIAAGEGHTTRELVSLKASALRRLLWTHDISNIIFSLWPLCFAIYTYPFDMVCRARSVVLLLQSEECVAYATARNTTAALTLLPCMDLHGRFFDECSSKIPSAPIASCFVLAVMTYSNIRLSAVMLWLALSAIFLPRIYFGSTFDTNSSFALEILVVAALTMAMTTFVFLLDRTMRTMFEDYLRLQVQVRRTSFVHRAVDNSLESLLPRYVLARVVAMEPVIDYMALAGLVVVELQDFGRWSTSALPRQVLACVSQYFALLDQCVVSQGLVKVKALGDRYIVAAPPQSVENVGNSVSNGADAASWLVDQTVGLLLFTFEAQLAARQMQQHRQMEVPFAAAIHVGEVVGAIIGNSNSSMSFELFGPGFTACLELASLAKRGMICGSETAVNILRSDPEWQRFVTLSPTEMKVAVQRRSLAGGGAQEVLEPVWIVGSAQATSGGAGSGDVVTSLPSPEDMQSSAARNGLSITPPQPLLHTDAESLQHIKEVHRLRYLALMRAANKASRDGSRATTTEMYHHFHDEVGEGSTSADNDGSAIVPSVSVLKATQQLLRKQGRSRNVTIATAAEIPSQLVEKLLLGALGSSNEKGTAGEDSQNPLLIVVNDDAITIEEFPRGGDIVHPTSERRLFGRQALSYLSTQSFAKRDRSFFPHWLVSSQLPSVIPPLFVDETVETEFRRYLLTSYRSWRTAGFVIHACVLIALTVASLVDCSKIQKLREDGVSLQPMASMSDITLVAKSKSVFLSGAAVVLGGMRALLGSKVAHAFSVLPETQYLWDVALGVVLNVLTVIGLATFPLNAVNNNPKYLLPFMSLLTAVVSLHWLHTLLMTVVSIACVVAAYLISHGAVLNPSAFVVAVGLPWGSVLYWASTHEANERRRFEGLCMGSALIHAMEDEIRLLRHMQAMLMPPHLVEVAIERASADPSSLTPIFQHYADLCTVEFRIDPMMAWSKALTPLEALRRVEATLAVVEKTVVKANQYALQFTAVNVGSSLLSRVQQCGDSVLYGGPLDVTELEQLRENDAKAFRTQMEKGVRSALVAAVYCVHKLLTSRVSLSAGDRKEKLSGQSSSTARLSLHSADWGASSAVADGSMPLSLIACCGFSLATLLGHKYPTFSLIGLAPRLSAALMHAAPPSFVGCSEGFARMASVCHSLLQRIEGSPTSSPRSASRDGTAIDENSSFAIGGWSFAGTSQPQASSVTLASYAPNSSLEPPPNLCSLWRSRRTRENFSPRSDDNTSATNGDGRWHEEVVVERPMKWRIRGSGVVSVFPFGLRRATVSQLPSSVSASV